MSGFNSFDQSKSFNQNNPSINYKQSLNIVSEKQVDIQFMGTVHDVNHRTQIVNREKVTIGQRRIGFVEIWAYPFYFKNVSDPALNEQYFGVCDGTGSIEVIESQEEDNPETTLKKAYATYQKDDKQIEDGYWCRIIARLKVVRINETNDKLVLQACKVTAITNPMDILSSRVQQQIEELNWRRQLKKFKLEQQQKDNQVNPNNEEDRDNVEVLNNRIRHTMIKNDGIDKSLLQRDISFILSRQASHSMRIDELIKYLSVNQVKNDIEIKLAEMTNMNKIYRSKDEIFLIFK